ncbi:UNVERIFIED_CONTAM: hypothetical protein HDU68_006010 [Siphonaria sp. JEL0065]|nr:hypothetical protein HDU68_006010 [Siphonaria sp. JEL0065]
MAQNKGTDSEGMRAMALEKERTLMMDGFKKQKEQIKKDTEVRIGADKFVAQTDSIQSDLIKHTVGLVKLEDFQKIKETLNKKRQEEIERGLNATQPKTKKKRDLTQTKKLSFAHDDGEEEDVAALEPVGMLA